MLAFAITIMKYYSYFKTKGFFLDLLPCVINIFSNFSRKGPWEAVLMSVSKNFFILISSLNDFRILKSKIAIALEY